MTWYAVHLCFSKGEIPDTKGVILVEESIYLLEGDSPASLNPKIEDRAAGVVSAMREGWFVREDGTKKIAEDAQFLGVRKIVAIQSDVGDDDLPVDQTELTYSYFEVESLEIAKKMADGDEVSVRYVE